MEYSFTHKNMIVLQPEEEPHMLFVIDPPPALPEKKMNVLQAGE